MKNIIWFLFPILLSACGTKPKVVHTYNLPPALSEVFRNGELAGLESRDAKTLGMPNPNDLVSHTCTSTPIFDIWGRFIRTDVRCW